VAANQVAVALRHGELLIKHEKAEQELATAFADAEETSRMKSQFLGMMSHELRTPLNAIGGYVQLLEEGIRGPMSAAQLVDLARIRRSQQHLLGVIENVLGFLKLGSGKVTYDIAEVSLDEVVGNVEEIMMPMIDSKSLKYSRQVETEHLKARADQEKTQQIVLNLLSNAVKFTDSGSDVGIHVVGDTATIRVRVVDGGCGIPADRLQQVFEPFVQVSSSGARSAGGTGLGLSISREFARGMGGDVVAQSSPGVGSTFTLELPRAGVA
jgi:signal transduction histidine kinase